METTTLNEESLLEGLLENNIDPIDIFEIQKGDEMDLLSDESAANVLKFELRTSPEMLNELQDVLYDKLNVTKLRASLEYFPVDDRIEMPQEDFDKNINMIEQLEELEDVDRVFHNIKI